MVCVEAQDQEVILDIILTMVGKYWRTLKTGKARPFFLL